jgi:hypothetical protein
VLKIKCPHCGEMHQISVRETYINGGLKPISLGHLGPRRPSVSPPGQPHRRRGWPRERARPAGSGCPDRSESSRQRACPRLSLPPPTLGERRHRGLARRLVALLPPRGPVYVSPASPRIARSAARPLSVSA